MKDAKNYTKIDSQQIDTFLSLMGELVIIKSQIIQEANMQNQNPRLAGLLLLLDKTVRELQEYTTSMRLTTISSAFFKAENASIAIATSLHKEIEIKMIGENTEIDRSIVDILPDCLIHLCKNAIDHGIEYPQEREEKGKKRIGTLTLKALRQGSRIIIEISDDGKGISTEKLYQKAIELKKIPSHITLETFLEKELIHTLIIPGLSTKDDADAISGRGVGLDAVYRTLQKLRGSLSCQTYSNIGTTFRLSIPITTSIIDALLFQLDHQIYALPLDVVQAIVHWEDIQVIDSKEKSSMVIIRHKAIPLLHLKEILHQKKSSPNIENLVVIIIDTPTGPIALQIDQIIGQQQVVVKNFGESISTSQGVAGAVILGDGKVGLILDTNDLLQHIHQDYES